MPKIVHVYSVIKRVLFMESKGLILKRNTYLMPVFNEVSLLYRTFFALCFNWNFSWSFCLLTQLWKSQKRLQHCHHSPRISHNSVNYWSVPVIQNMQKRSDAKWHASKKLCVFVCVCMCVCVCLDRLRNNLKGFTENIFYMEFPAFRYFKVFKQLTKSMINFYLSFIFNTSFRTSYMSAIFVSFPLTISKPSTTSQI